MFHLVAVVAIGFVRKVSRVIPYFLFSKFILLILVHPAVHSQSKFFRRPQLRSKTIQKSVEATYLIEIQKIKKIELI